MVCANSCGGDWSNIELCSTSFSENKSSSFENRDDIAATWSLDAGVGEDVRECEKLNEDSYGAAAGVDKNVLGHAVVDGSADKKAFENVSLISLTIEGKAGDADERGNKKVDDAKSHHFPSAWASAFDF